MVKPGRFVPRGAGERHRQVEFVLLAPNERGEVVGDAVIVDRRELALLARRKLQGLIYRCSIPSGR